MINGKLLKYKAGDYGRKADIKDYFKEEGEVLYVTHFFSNAHNFTYWLKSYGLTDWAIDSNLPPDEFKRLHHNKTLDELEAMGN
jgi:hypothetical protein